MNKFYSKIGTINQADNTTYVDVKQFDQGCVVYGPYESLGQGSYFVRFRIDPDAQSEEAAFCCKLDVVSDFGKTVLAERRLTTGELRARAGEIDLKFNLPRAATVEYRVFSTGAAAFRVTYERKATPILDKALQADNVESNPLFRANYGRLGFLAGRGARYASDNGRIVAKVDRVAIYLASDENISVFAAIFFNNEYNMLLPKKCIAIDIGMNVGIASLFLANNHNIDRVYAFEPFKAAYTSALENFHLNASLSNKIVPHHIGLSDKDMTLEVLSQDNNTVGNTITGRASGSMEKIEVRDAGRTLKPLIMEAREQGLGVIMKIDCEGAEYWIFKSLVREDLFHSVDAIMMEWHKTREGSKERLARTLVDAGFAVFDPSPVGASIGYLIAARVTQAAKPMLC